LLIYGRYQPAIILEVIKPFYENYEDQLKDIVRRLNEVSEMAKEKGATPLVKHSWNRVVKVI
jgi:hypothetical protein